MCIASTGSALKLIPEEHRSEVLSSLTWFRQSSQTAFGLGDRIETILAHFLSRRSVLPFFLVAAPGRRYQTPQTCPTVAGQRISDCLFHRECHFAPSREQSLCCESVYMLTEKIPLNHCHVGNHSIDKILPFQLSLIQPSDLR